MKINCSKAKRNPVKSAVILSFPLASGALFAYLSFDSGEKQLWACVGKGVVLLVKRAPFGLVAFSAGKRKERPAARRGFQVKRGILLGLLGSFQPPPLTERHVFRGSRLFSRL